MDPTRQPHRGTERSRSPREDRESRRHRSRSPYHKHHHRRGDAEPKQPVRLPFRREPLEKRDLQQYEALFAEYLDVQKHLYIEDLSKDEVRGRWKSFLGKWNRGELAEGWYDPDMLRRAAERYALSKNNGRSDKGNPTVRRSAEIAQTVLAGSDDDDADFGPALPSSHNRGAGPAIPSIEDLQHRRELAEEDREAQIADARYERKQDRKVQKERLDDLVPRADPGSRERQLEKKRETAAVNRAFQEAKSPGAAEVGEGELMGDEGIDSYKAKLKAQEKVKNEREIRKEEVLRARAAEREERLAEHRKKEDNTMQMLKEIARQRFG